MEIRVSYIASFLVLSMIISGCSINNVNSTESLSPVQTSIPLSTEQTGVKSELPNLSLLEEFKNQSLEDIPADELRNTLKQVIKEVPSKDADEFIRIMEAYYQTNLPVVEIEMAADQVQSALASLTWPFTENQLSAIQDESVRSFIEKILNGGYKLEMTEGYVFPIVDYGKLLTFGDRITTAMKTYLDLMAMESDEKSSSDGGLVITLEELSRRTLAAESYVIHFPDTLERSKVEDRYIQYLTNFLIGMDNSPIYDPKSFLIVPQVKTRLKDMVSLHGETITGQLTEQFLTILSETSDAMYSKGEKGEKISIPVLKNFQDKLENTARSMLPQIKNK